MSRSYTTETFGQGEIRVEEDALTRLHYRVLSHLDFGEDRANLYDSSLEERPWVEPLERAYLASEHSDLVQVLPLLALGDARRVATPESALSLLRDRGSSDRLAGALRKAYRSEIESRDAGLDSGSSRRLREVRATLNGIRQRLRALRAKLWSEADRPAPPLRIVDAPALEAPGCWSRGRACSRGGVRLVAVCTDVPVRRVLVQILHEEIHPVTDPVVPNDESVGTDCTRAREQTAVDVGAALLEAVDPDLVETYDAWRRRFSGVR